MYVLVLGLDVLGNPFALITGLKEGAIDFFYEPYQVRCAPFPEFAQQGEVGENPGNEAGFEEVQSFRFWVENEYEMRIAHAWTSVILAGKRDSQRHSTTSLLLARMS